MVEKARNRRRRRRRRQAGRKRTKEKKNRKLGTQTFKRGSDGIEGSGGSFKRGFKKALNQTVFPVQLI